SRRSGALATAWRPGQRLRQPRPARRHEAARRPAGRWLMGRAPSRLRWQLALSHLVVVGFTFACMIAAALLLAGVMANLRDQARREPANEAWQVARAIGGLVTDGQPAELNSILRALAAGQLRLLDQGPPFGPPAWRQADWLAPS